MIYRFTFNGKKSDHEVKGDRNSYTTEFRQFDPRLGKWLTDDPLTSNDQDILETYRPLSSRIFHGGLK